MRIDSYRDSYGWCVDDDTYKWVMFEHFKDFNVLMLYYSYFDSDDNLHEDDTTWKLSSVNFFSI